MLVMGIDVGVTGGIAILGDSPTKARACVMPMLGERSDIDPLTLTDWLELMQKELNDTIHLTVVEKAIPMPGQRSTSTHSNGSMFGQTKMFLRMSKISFVLATPQQWKKSILSGTAKDKAAAIAYCLNMYPTVDINVGKKKTIYHDGMADALCIAEYAKRVLHSDGVLL